MKNNWIVGLTFIAVIIAILAIRNQQEKRYWQGVTDSIIHQHSGVPLDEEASKAMKLRAILDGLRTFLGAEQSGHAEGKRDGGGS